MYHDSQNNFRSYYRGYPWNCNGVEEAQKSEEMSDETVINAAHDQLEAILTMKPFDPEEFGFKFDKERDLFYKRMSETTEHVLLHNIDKKKYGEWTFITKHRMEPRFNQQLYIPNDLAGRIILTGLGIVPRRDLDSEGNGCANDDNLDGICLMCESSGSCQNKLNVE